MASLSALPAEILSRIAQYLVKANLGFEDDGIYSLRLACRATCLKTQYEFGKAAFSTLRIDLHSKTLQHLLTVCKCPAFGEAVKKIVFAHWYKDYISFSGVETDNEEWTTLEEQVRYVISRIFADAFTGMPNLEEVVIAAPFIARFQRNYSVPNTEFSLVNWKASEGVSQDSRSEQEGFRLEDFSVLTDDLYSLITDAASSTGCRLSNIRTTASTPAYCEGRVLPAFGILEDRFAKSLSTLKHIQHLDLDVYVHAFDNSNENRTEENNVPTQEQFSDIITTMQQLVTLCLRFIGSKRTASLSPLLETICTPSCTSLSRLANLSLTTVLIEEYALATLLLNHKTTLRSLTLRYVRLDGSWAVILNDLLEEMPVLDELYLHKLQERSKHVYAMEDDRARSSFNYWGRLETVAGIKNLMRTMCFNDY